MKFIFKLVAVLFLIILLVFSYLFYSQINNKDCLNISERDAKLMIGRILQNKESRSNTGLILFDFKLNDIEYVSIKNSIKQSTDELEYVDLLYKKINSEVSLFNAIIYGNCEVQWIKVAT